jgi:methylmalonyl-CoA mutase cobalamin-binding subunit
MMNLAESTFTDHSVEVKVIKRDLGREIDVLGGRTTHDSIVRRGKGGKVMVVGQTWEAYKKQGEIIMPDKGTRGAGGQCMPRGLRRDNRALQRRP